MNDINLDYCGRESFVLTLIEFIEIGELAVKVVTEAVCL